MPQAANKLDNSLVLFLRDFISEHMEILTSVQETIECRRIIKYLDGMAKGKLPVSHQPESFRYPTVFRLGVLPFVVDAPGQPDVAVHSTRPRLTVEGDGIATFTEFDFPKAELYGELLKQLHLYDIESDELASKVPSYALGVPQGLFLASVELTPEGVASLLFACKSEVGLPPAYRNRGNVLEPLYRSSATMLLARTDTKPHLSRALVRILSHVQGW